VRSLTPGASAESPLGNNFPYQDQNNNLRYNAISQGAGLGFLDTHRDQGNMSLALFRGPHEIKFGADYQDVSQETFNNIGVLFRGRGYNLNAPGGFTTPADKRVFDATAPVETTAEVLSAYAQDRFDVTERFNLYLGVRMDDQAFDNDAGAEVNSSTDFAPRLGATWDLNGNSTLLLKATAGRYYQVTGQDIFNREYATKPNGTNQFTQIRWNPATLRYDGQSQRTLAAVGVDPGTFDPYYKDEVSLGLEWQFVPSWAFQARASRWEIDDTFWATDQWNAAGVVVRDVRNWDAGFREYDGVQLELNRSMRDNWTLRTNYTYGENNGNNFGAGDGTVDEDDLFEGLGGVEVCGATAYAGCVPGSTIATVRHREGRGNSDRTHNLNIVGLKVFPVGEKNDIGLGGYFGYRSGERYGLRPNTTLSRAGTTQTISTTTYLEDRDAEQMEDTMTLNLTGYWQFPIRGVVQGRVGVEAVNITDEQEVISINIANGAPDAGKVAYQAPREYRLQVGITF
jgi:TonB-dependent receptor-like protein